MTNWSFSAQVITSGKGVGQADALVKLADGQQASVAGELACGRLNDQRRAEEVQDLGPATWYTHGLSPGLQNRPGGSTG
jgi:hypothetical protein